MRIELKRRVASAGEGLLSVGAELAGEARALEDLADHPLVHQVVLDDQDGRVRDGLKRRTLPLDGTGRQLDGPHGDAHVDACSLAGTGAERDLSAERLDALIAQRETQTEAAVALRGREVALDERLAQVADPVEVEAAPGVGKFELQVLPVEVDGQGDLAAVRELDCVLREELDHSLE